MDLLPSRECIGLSCRLSLYSLQVQSPPDSWLKQIIILQNTFERQIVRNYFSLINDNDKKPSAKYQIGNIIKLGIWTNPKSREKYYRWAKRFSLKPILISKTHFISIKTSSKLVDSHQRLKQLT